MIKLRNVSKIYANGAKALVNVNLNIEKGNLFFGWAEWSGKVYFSQTVV